MRKIAIIIKLFVLITSLFLLPVSASINDVETHISSEQLLLFLGVVILFAKISSYIENAKQPPVLGELLTGIILGNLGIVGIQFFNQFKSSEIIHFISQLGVILLLFTIGLESNLTKITQVGFKALSVAMVGVLLSMGGIFIAVAFFFPDYPILNKVFFAAGLASTSVGISSTVFKSLHKLRCKEACIFLGAAVIDDIVGVMILSALTGLLTAGSVSISAVAIISIKAIVFLGGSLALGQLLAPIIIELFSRISASIHMKMAIAISFCFIYGYLAKLFGLEPVIGAFAAGLVLDPVHFKKFREPAFIEELKNKLSLHHHEDKVVLDKIVEKHSKKHVEELVDHLGAIFIPIFFVFTGMAVDIQVFKDLKIVGISFVIAVVASITKFGAGFVSGSNVSRRLIGSAMIPRGEVVLIYANLGVTTGLLDQTAFSVMVLVVLFTSIIAPLLINQFAAEDLIKKPEPKSVNPNLAGL